MPPVVSDAGVEATPQRQGTAVECGGRGGLEGAAQGSDGLKQLSKMPAACDLDMRLLDAVQAPSTPPQPPQPPGLPPENLLAGRTPPEDHPISPVAKRQKQSIDAKAAFPDSAHLPYAPPPSSCTTPAPPPSRTGPTTRTWEGAVADRARQLVGHFGCFRFSRFRLLRAGWSSTAHVGSHWRMFRVQH